MIVHQVCKKNIFHNMSMDPMLILYTTFFIWFLTWTLLESIMTYYKVSTINKIKIIFILLIIAIFNYVRIRRSREDKEYSCDCNVS